MHRFVNVAIALCLTTGLAHAEGGHVPPPTPPVIVAPEVTDWSGGYVGLAYGLHSGEQFQTITGNELREMDGESLGALAGYNFQNGAFVFGGEAVLWFNQPFAHPDGDNVTIETLVDLRARAGYAFGSLLVYGAAGVSFGEHGYNTQAVPSDGTFDAHGFNLGLGAEFQVTDRITLGADYTWREMEGRITGLTAGPADPAFNDRTIRAETFSLRAAFRF